jgi:hypothetical protein
MGDRAVGGNPAARGSRRFGGRAACATRFPKLGRDARMTIDSSLERNETGHDEQYTELPLSGLEPDNLLAFLALLGLLRILEVARPEWRPRIAWRGTPTGAVLACNSDELQDVDVASAALAALPLFNNSFAHFATRTGLIPSYRPKVQGERANRSKRRKSREKKTRIPESERVDLFTEFVQRILSGYQEVTADTTSFDHHRFALDAVAAFARQAIEKGVYCIEDSPLKLPSGQQAFVGLIRQLLATRMGPFGQGKNASQIEEIRKALFSAWTYADKGESLRLAPQEDRRYAYRFSDPSPEGARTERGANLLAAIGLMCIPLCPGDTTSPLVAYRGRRVSGSFTWPIWEPYASLAGIVALLRHPELSAHEPQLESLRAYGVVSLMRCRRYVLPSGEGDYGNVSLAVQLTA